MTGWSRFIQAVTLSLVACHNDLKPQNIIFDGTSAFCWLTGRRSFLNDRVFRSCAGGELLCEG